MNSIFTIVDSNAASYLEAVRKNMSNAEPVFTVGCNKLGQWVSVELSDDLFRRFQETKGIRVPQTNPHFSEYQNRPECTDRGSYVVVPLGNSKVVKVDDSNVVKEAVFLYAMRNVWAECGGSGGFKTNYKFVPVQR